MVKIITWNMQGACHSTEGKWRVDIPLLMDMADICCLQECGTLPSTAILHTDYICDYEDFKLYTWNLGTWDRPNIYYILHYYWDAGANRCNLAIVTKEKPKKAHIVTNGTWYEGRPSIGILYNGMNYFTIHASAGSRGGDAAKMLDDIEGFIDPGENWFAAGDFNREPYDLIIPYEKCPANGNTHPAIHPEKMLDYGVLKEGDPITGTVLSDYRSDHYPVLFEL
ncbi:cytolethal distending toxin subunit B [Methanococcus maripaludis]|uniref:Cytolethal distending toxin subunit B n=1 Tax=Methanococcus maripaludis TaxID=39152 RepID=A0A7J9P7J2_METMI|nr:endonuclease/exonuclease/phosphatase family protein [Methanococcus maripaludis]MBA2858708.1 cytolethal distending toxin subunit B [Methanococcus maripaludis]